MSGPSGSGGRSTRARAAPRGRNRTQRTHITLLGRFALRVDGIHRKLPRAASRLIALLAVNHGAVMRAEAAPTLTPHLEPEHAAGSLRVALARLRATGLPVLETDGAVLRLADHVTVDIHEAEALATRLATQGPDARPDAGLKLLTLVLLPEWSEDWVQLERQRLRDLCFDALERHARALATRGEVGPALQVIHMALRADPLRESAVLVLIEIHLSQANGVAAKGAYLAYHERSMRVLDIEPSDELQDLVAPLLREQGARRRGIRIRRVPQWEWAK